MNNNLYGWNPVYNFVMKIKHEFENKLGAVSYEKIERKNAFFTANLKEKRVEA